MAGWFSRKYDSLMAPLERKKLRELRRQLAGSAEGRVLEIGAGTGANFPYYRGAEEVVAMEPDPLMRAQSLERAAAADVPVRVVGGAAEEIPYADGEFDTVVCTLVLCTVADPVQVLKELRRVCKPGGRLLFMEHVRLERPILGRLQDWLTPFWKRVCGGCRLNRRTTDLIREAGIEVASIQSIYNGLFLVIEGR